MKFLTRLPAALLPLAALAATTFAEPAWIAENGEPRVQIVVAEKASVAARQSATRLADLLGKICEAKFEVTAGDGRRGITVAGQRFPGVARATDLEGSFRGRCPHILPDGRRVVPARRSRAKDKTP